MFYALESRALFGWDQVDNAWAAVRILVAHKFPLLGMVAKGNSGIYIGPLYYYLVAIFYFITGLDPIAAPILAGVTSLLSFWVIYYVAKNIFNKNVALISCLIYTFSSHIIETERIQWPVNFIAMLSLLIFYFLYRILRGKIRYFVHLGIVMGLSLHVHFTSLFYPVIILMTLPFLPKTMKTLRYLLIFAGIVALFLVPHVMYYASIPGNSGTANFGEYLQTYYHGFHLQRMLQLTHDAFIKFQAILELSAPFLSSVTFLFLPLFYIAYLTGTHDKRWFNLVYVVTLWFLVPWILFSTYSGEISDYYFNTHLYVAILILGFISMWIWNSRNVLLRMGLFTFWLYYVLTNTQSFMGKSKSDFVKNKSAAQEAVLSGKRIEFSMGDPKSYLYYYYSYKYKKPLPYEM